MALADFVHLRVHTAYSLSEGALKLDALAALCRELEMPAVAMTDSGNLFGAMEFSLACAKQGVQPIIGCQLAIRREDGAGEPGTAGRSLPPDHLVLLATSAEGYWNLVELVSRAFLETEPPEVPQIDLASVEAKAAGLVALTGGPSGGVGRLLTEGQDAAARTLLERLKAAFPGCLYVELMRHGDSAEDAIEPVLLDLADALDLPLVATNDAYFPTRDMYESHDVLMCLAQGAYLGDQDRRRLTAEHYFKPAAEMRELFADIPEAIDNTLVVARRCAFMLEEEDPLLPRAPVADGKSESEALADLAREGLDARLKAQVFETGMDEAAREEAARPYRERLDYELGVIDQMGYPGYFLIVAEFIQWAKQQEIPVGPGRGSGAGSVVAWALTITDLDPMRFDLLFERFLNPERISMPDFDIDFCVDGRDDVIRHVTELYGADRVAQIITFGTLQSKAVVRDVGRILGMPYGQVDRISKLIPVEAAKPVSLKDALIKEPALEQMRRSDEEVAALINIAQPLEGLYRHASTHAAGVVIGDRPLTELVPLYRDPRSNMPVTQFSMKNVERAGLVKFDFLGLKTLTVLARARELIRARGEDIDIQALPLDDAPTYEMLSRAETVGVFQMESAGMRDVLRRLRPDRFEDLIAVVALYRPGPMENIPRYIACKHGEEEPDYLYPTLEKILKETFGIIVYQEQVMQIAQELSGYSLGGADILRRAMGKKDQAEMDSQRQTFVEGAAARGVDKAQAAGIFDLVDKFAGYGFNKSHAAAYAMVAYQTAYLKANYPVEFLAACMTLDISNTDKLNVYKQEAQRLDIAMLPPDINRSDVTFTVEDGAVRYALAAVKNVGRQAMTDMVAERRANGPFTDIADFAHRIDPHALNKRSLENLVKSGTMDGLESNRARLFSGIEAVLREAASATADRDSGQSSLFGGGPETEAAPALMLPECGDWLPMDRLSHEFEALGFYLSAHPLDSYGKRLARLGVIASDSIEERIAAGGAMRVKVAGTVLSKRELSGQRGRIAFVQMSDSAGTFEVTLYSEVLSGCRDLLDSGEPLLVEANASMRDDSPRLSVQTVQRLDDVIGHDSGELNVFLTAKGAIDSLKSVLGRENGGRGEVVLVSRLDDGREVEIVLPARYAVSPRMTQAIKHLDGVLDVREA